MKYVYVAALCLILLGCTALDVQPSPPGEDLLTTREPGTVPTVAPTITHTPFPTSWVLHPTATADP